MNVAERVQSSIRAVNAAERESVVAGPFTLYRGVAGPEPDRRVSGLSWTHSVEDARWFAQNHARRLREWISDPDPAVCRVTVDAAAVLVYTNVHEEQEFIVMLSPGITPERIE